MREYIRDNMEVFTLVCKLKRPIYGMKQDSRQGHLKLDEVHTSFGFKENKVD